MILSMNNLYRCQIYLLIISEPSSTHMASSVIDIDDTDIDYID